MGRTHSEMVERMGVSFEADGLPRIAGKIVGSLMLHREPRSLDELARSLRISKASASSNARLLERMGVLERVSRPGDRRDFYLIAADAHLRLLELALRRLSRMRDLLADAARSPVAGDAITRERVETCAAFFSHMLEEITAAGDAWVRMRADTPSTMDATSRRDAA